MNIHKNAKLTPLGRERRVNLPACLLRQTAGRDVTPKQRHSGEDVTILRQRHERYEAARRQHPARWSPSLPKGGPVIRTTGVTSEKSG